MHLLHSLCAHTLKIVWIDTQFHVLLLFHHSCPFVCLQACLDKLLEHLSVCPGSFSGFRRGFNPSRELSSNSVFFNLYQDRCLFICHPHENQLFSVFLFSFATAARRLVLVFHLLIASLFCFPKIYLRTSILLRRIRSSYKLLSFHSLGVLHMEAW